MLMIFNFFMFLMFLGYEAMLCHDVTITVSPISGYGLARKIVFFWLFI